MGSRKPRKARALLQSKDCPFLRVVEHGGAGPYLFTVEAYDGADLLGVDRWVPFGVKLERYAGQDFLRGRLREARERLLLLACRELMQRRRRRARSKGGV